MVSIMTNSEAKLAQLLDRRVKTQTLFQDNLFLADGEVLTLRYRPSGGRSSQAVMMAGSQVSTKGAANGDSFMTCRHQQSMICSYAAGRT